MAYEYKSNWTLGGNEPNTNPIKANKMPKQTQYKPKTNPIKPNPPTPVFWPKIRVLRFLIQRFLTSQDMVVVLCEPVCFVPDVL